MKVEIDIREQTTAHTATRCSEIEFCSRPQADIELQFRYVDLFFVQVADKETIEEGQGIAEATVEELCDAQRVVAEGEGSKLREELRIDRDAQRSEKREKCAELSLDQGQLPEGASARGSIALFGGTFG